VYYTHKVTFEYKWLGTLINSYSRGAFV
jgi:hypothetical protein